MTPADDPTTMNQPRPALWAEGWIALAPAPAGGRSPAAVVMDRPFATIGRSEGSDLRIEDRALSGRHVYLHLDRRGLFAVDLATRSGSKIGPEGRRSGWLVPGDSLEIAGHRVEVVEAQVDGGPAARPEGAGPDPLGGAGPSLSRVSLVGPDEGREPLDLASELVFVGRSPACGVCVKGQSVAKVQCALVRSPSGPYVVDLIGWGTWHNGRPLRGAAPLADGDTLVVGESRYTARVGPPRPDWLPAEIVAEGRASPSQLAAIPPLPPGLGVENQGAILAWMMGVLQAGQAQILQQQQDFEHRMSRTLKQVHREQSSLLNKHLDRVENVHRELAGLREEIRRRYVPAEAPASAPRLAAPPAVPLRIAATPPPADPEAATAWLLDRVRRIEDESRSTWRDLFGRLHRPGRPGA